MDETLCRNLTQEQRDAVAAMIDALEVVQYELPRKVPPWILIECLDALKKGLKAFDPNAPGA